MLDCKQVLSQLSECLDDELTVELAQAIAEHLARCHRCSVVYDTSRKTLKIVTEAEPFEVPLAVSARLYTRLQELFAGE